MKIDKRSRYAVCSILHLAKNDGKGPVCLEELSKRFGISVSYLEPMFKQLKKARLVKSYRGPGGGYEIINLSGMSEADVVSAVSGKRIKLKKSSPSDDVAWNSISEAIREGLASRKISDLLL
jgi:Rrf2 family iron-sulfur cluster assembly transcriptional regulator